MLNAILLIALVPSFISGGTKTDYERLMELMKEEHTDFVLLAQLKDEHVRLTEAVSIAKKEHLSVFRRRDRTVVRINGFKRILKGRRIKFRKLVGAYYKISRSVYGRSFIDSAHATLPVSGAHSMKLILKREASEIEAIEEGLRRLDKDKQLLNATLRSYETIISKLGIRSSEVEAAIARTAHKLQIASMKRQKYPRTLFDASTWNLWHKIVSLRKKYGKKPLPFEKNRGIMARPVPGAYLKDRTGSKGVYISAKPGMNVRSPEGGVVRFTGKVKGYGQVVVVEHQDSYYSLMGRLEYIGVKKGATIKKGQAVGKAATLGNAPYVPVYYELRKGTTYLNPKLWLR